MDRDRIDAVLAACEQAVASGGQPDLRAEGFWAAVAAIKGNPSLVDEFSGRVAAIDTVVFTRWALIAVPFAVGTALVLAGTVVGLVLVGLAYGFDQPWNGLTLLAGTGVLLVTTHSLGHVLAGVAAGMRFTHWFVGTIRMPHPGVKVDYATYLAAPARARAWMHASGAIVTKTIPFLMLGAALAMEAPWWAVAALAAAGVVALITDVLWSTKSSDWKKFRRELRYVTPQSMRPE
jgi:hypothetical protein